jgi:hypothetical protein
VCAFPSSATNAISISYRERSVAREVGMYFSRYEKADGHCASPGSRGAVLAVRSRREKASISSCSLGTATMKSIRDFRYVPYIAASRIRYAATATPP